MKLLWILFGFLVLLQFHSPSQAGLLDQRYFWCDSIAVSGTHQDSAFAVEWDFVTIYADSVGLWLRAGAPDVTNWSSRDAFYLPAGMNVSFGPANKLNRLEFWTVSGTGHVYLIGYKKSRQQ